MPDYAKSLNVAQLDAVTCNDKAVLVVAGAGSGKTRTITYRLTWLVEQGFKPESILLLTFTRKAAHEMLARSAMLLQQPLDGIAGGTFHSFAYGALRRLPPGWLDGRTFTLMDASDITQAIRECRQNLKLGSRDSSFPKTQAVAAILSKARNKELPIEEIIRKESFHLLPHLQAIEDIGKAYQDLKRRQGLLDYDDLLFELKDLLSANDTRSTKIRSRFSNILVDEYQDTNIVQAEIIRLLSLPCSEGTKLRASANVMAVGDEAQSIYAFRGANVRNILDFPAIFPGTRIIRLEENYRSTQQILNVANRILSHAPESFHKVLYSNKMDGELVRKIQPLSDASESKLIVNRIQELLVDNLPHEIAVLFRAGYHSYHLENELRKAGIHFRKYGGLRFVEASHVKDLLAFVRLVLNPTDYQAFSRIASMHKGIGDKTASKIHGYLLNNNTVALDKSLKKFGGLRDDLNFIDNLRMVDLPVSLFFEKLLTYYRPRLEVLYPDDWPNRLPGLDEIVQIAQNYDALDLFIADLALDSSDEKNDDEQNCITLSTIHSAKGLEWNAVLILDLVEDRFPSRHSQANPEDYEEERRLFYVACTRAKKILELYSPSTVYKRGENINIPAIQSPFLRELTSSDTVDYLEKYDGILVPKNNDLLPGNYNEKIIETVIKDPFRDNKLDKPIKTKPQNLGYCRHRIFGRGKIVKKIDEEKMQVNFPGFGLKVILSDYLIMED